MNYKQIEEKREKVKKTLNLYREARTLAELSKLTGYSTSSLQRYLTCDSQKYISPEEYEEIKYWLKNAKLRGNINGGHISQEKYGYSKDETGKFQGKGK